MKRQYIGVVTILGIAAFLFGPSLAHAADPVPLGTMSTYGVVSSTFTNTAAGTSINGTAGQPVLCYSTPPATAASVIGLIVVPCDPQVGQDQLDATANLNLQADTTCTNILDGVGLNAIVIGGGVPGHFPPGCYTRAGALTIDDNGIVFLDGPGVYIFRSTGGGLSTGANSLFTLAEGVCETDVYWGLTGAATLGATSQFAGNILAAAGITIGANTVLTGRALAFPETVTTGASATVNVPICAGAVVCPTITLGTADLADGTVGLAYSDFIPPATGGGETTYTYSVGSGLPPGLTLDPSSGEVAGTPTVAGTFNFTVTGTDNATDCFGTQDYSIVILAAAPAPAIPALDFIGLALLTVLLAGVGMFVVNKFSV